MTTVYWIVAAVWGVWVLLDEVLRRDMLLVLRRTVLNTKAAIVLHVLDSLLLAGFYAVLWPVSVPFDIAIKIVDRRVRR